ncbi:hypothetical protein SAMN04487906_2678 [Zhouia amylolytica]|uniref:Tetratricopeptide repeat-containing protein n=1 Tax=Zhouia amylolytica TaxID=376730 RepID=A0A1I6URU7_9FLAO|nr:hypothetical protein [Zhouia amylolytica]SFT04178.1 hypothetical protein SAMN04487906_2678 [Zhouia amylolytica]
MKKICSSIFSLVFVMLIYGNTSFPSYAEIPFQEKWKTLAQNKQYLEAASELLYLMHADDTRKKTVDFWNIGQMYAMANQYDKAIFYMKKSITDYSDKQWTWYCKGTIAFLENDKQKLALYATDLSEDHDDYYAPNVEILNMLLKNFGKPYEQAYTGKY